MDKDGKLVVYLIFDLLRCCFLWVVEWYNPDVAKIPSTCFLYCTVVTVLLMFRTVFDYWYYAPTACGFYCMVVQEVLRCIVLRAIVEGTH